MRFIIAYVVVRKRDDLRTHQRASLFQKNPNYFIMYRLLYLIYVVKYL